MANDLVTTAEIEAHAYLATLEGDIAERRRFLVDSLCEHYPNITGLDPYTDMLLEALVAARTTGQDLAASKLKEIRGVLDQGHNAAYDLSNDIRDILDREESQ
jgi:hypothetical protein